MTDNVSKKAENPETEIERLRKVSARSDKESDSLSSLNLAQQQQICELLVSMRKQAGVSLEEMSKRTGISASELWKAEDGSSRASLLGYLADYCTALGKTFTISFDDCEDAGKERN
ncbi:helix-turn-helix domain-containing protein [Bifidobacterium sp. LC6]|uniref:Helix-turn-helix domain-containing protein n=1 Tax=Bifidobacterium colobi TaxID=2809026 RepID=A0ABS5UWF7_9BIFI|nr:helix-turn-helix transcriptional regulator [Bifidobacterium colobi]MBT1175452.1 helix-turn-helix domain-containing protein [Bifidobacterium colobi]